MARTEHQYFDLVLPKGLSKDQREAIAAEVIAYIRERTLEGKLFNEETGREFKYSKGYSKAYKDSVAFRAGEKGSTVNLTLSGDMLAALDIIKNTEGLVRIGYQKGSLENAKADGNIRGTYGKATENSKLAKPFLGISDAKLREFLKNYKNPDEAEARTEAIKQAMAEAEKKIDRIVKSESEIKDGDKLRDAFRLEIGENGE